MPALPPPSSLRAVCRALAHPVRGNLCLGVKQVVSGGAWLLLRGAVALGEEVDVVLLVGHECWGWYRVGAVVTQAPTAGGYLAAIRFREPLSREHLLDLVGPDGLTDDSWSGIPGRGRAIP